jgi:hypothetical protein
MDDQTGSLDKKVDEILPAKKPRYEAWSNVQLTKAERKGKTPKEIHDLRKARYEGKA